LWENLSENRLKKFNVEKRYCCFHKKKKNLIKNIIQLGIVWLVVILEVMLLMKQNILFIFKVAFRNKEVNFEGLILLLLLLLLFE